MSQKLSVDGFKWIYDKFIFDENFMEKSIKKYYGNIDKEYILEVDVTYPKKLHELHSDVLFLPERLEIKNCERPVCNLYNKKNYLIHINSLKRH